MIVVGTVYYHPIAIFHYFYGTLLILTGDAVLSYMFIIFNARCEGMGIAMEMKMRLRVESGKDHCHLRRSRGNYYYYGLEHTISTFEIASDNVRDINTNQ